MGISRPRGDHRALLLSEGGEQVKNEWVHIRAQLGNDELHALCHQP
jgi:hypothetical protein